MVNIAEMPPHVMEQLGADTFRAVLACLTAAREEAEKQGEEEPARKSKKQSAILSGNSEKSRKLRRGRQLIRPSKTCLRPGLMSGKSSAQLSGLCGEQTRRCRWRSGHYKRRIRRRRLRGMA